MISYNFPIWTGALDNRPQNISAQNFTINQSSNGLIQQDVGNNVINNIIDGYLEDEYNFITNPPGLSEWATKVGDKYKDYVKQCINSFKNLDILEIGGGSEYFGSDAMIKGAKSYTIIDPAMNETNINNFQIIKDYFGSKSIFIKKFDLILSFNTIEHVPDPFDFMLGIKNNLKSNGKTILIFPDIEFQFLMGDFNALLHEHINYFTFSSSKMVFEKAGFKIINHFSREDTFYFCLKKSRTKENKIILDQIELLKKAQTAQNTNLKYFKNKVKLATQIGKLGFHGCCAGLNNLIYLSAISENPNVYLFDGDLSKKGKYMSGSRKEINHSSDPEYAEMDFIIISAMTFYEEIKKFAIENCGIDEYRIFSVIESI